MTGMEPVTSPAVRVQGASFAALARVSTLRPNSTGCPLIPAGYPNRSGGRVEHKKRA